MLFLSREKQNGNAMHNINYSYANNRQNRLTAISATGLNSSSYQEEPTGNLTRDNGENFNVTWTASGKVKSVTGNGRNIAFSYSPSGQRQIKRDAAGGKHYYIHDASGNVIAMYRRSSNGNDLSLLNRFIYGIQRIGMFIEGVEIGLAPVNANRPNRIVGAREYELTDHLGNVTSIISDHKFPIALPVPRADSVDYYTPQMVRSLTDYYPFGLPMPERSNTSLSYRYGFNGQEKDNEVYGLGASYSAEFWQYDARLGRRWNLEPRPNPSISPFATFANNPIVYSDVLGDTVRGNNATSAERMLSTIQSSFSGDNAANLRNLFSLASDGITMSSINEQSFNYAVSDLSTDAQQLAYAYFQAINSTDVHTVELIKREENLSKYGATSIGFKIGVELDKKGGGVNLTYSNSRNSYSIILMNSTANIPGYVSNGQSTTKRSSAGELLAHEMLGHGLGWSFGSPTSGHEDAIQMTNLYLRAVGQNYYRSGQGHIQDAPALIKVTATSIPSFVQIPQNIQMNISRIRLTPVITVPIDNTRVVRNH